jgi:selenide,water dikinase
MEEPRALAIPSGCQSKLNAQMLKDLLDDAFGGELCSVNPGRVPEDSALIDGVPAQVLFSCDFGTLMPTDFRVAGRIAALHAISDIYASGGKPLWGLSLVGLTVQIDRADAVELLKGINDACHEARMQIVGGHTLHGTVPMAGLAVIGSVIDKPIRKGRAAAGLGLYLSKRLGVGIAMQAKRLGFAKESLVRGAINSLTQSNEQVSVAAVSIGAVSCTDVSGFGFLVHLIQLLASGAGARIEFSKLRCLPELEELPEHLFHTSWISANLEYASDTIHIRHRLAQREIAILADPQTNGGLLVAADMRHADQLLSAGCDHIGMVTDTAQIEII